MASYLSGENGLFPKRKNSAIQNVREMVAALNILSARQVSSEQVPKILGQDFYDNYEIVQEARSTLNDKLYRANEKLKFDPTNQELKEKVKALHAEKNDLEKQVKIF